MLSTNECYLLSYVLSHFDEHSDLMPMDVAAEMLCSIHILIMT